LTIRSRLAAALAVAVATTLHATFVASALAGEPIELSARSVPLHPEEPSVTSVGRLSYRGGIEITSPDKRFGGWSALMVSPDGDRLIAVSDVGRWLTARIRYAADGRLVGLSDALLGPLRNREGNPLKGRDADAEAVTRLGDRYIVAFERNYRLEAYAVGDWREPFPGPARRYTYPREVKDAPANGGIEALTALPGNRLLAIAEDLEDGDGHALAWLFDAGRWHGLKYAWTGRYRVSDLTLLPNDDVLVLERRFTWLGGFASRIARVPLSAVVPGTALQGDEIAVIDPPLTTENFEGMAARRSAAGETLVYLIADNNFLFVQRTLLMMFALRE
jgi:hypothetical protein